MTTVNAVGTSLAGQTGTGTFAGSTSPTLVTPTLGVATATSLTFGGSVLSTYLSEGTWTPVFTFATPGNLSVAYTLQAGFYTQIGSIIFFKVALNFTPTYTTASGAALITGLPVAASSTAGSGPYFSIPVFLGALTTFPTGTTQLYGFISASSTQIGMSGVGSGNVNTGITTTNIPTTGVTAFQFTGWYYV